MFDEAKTEVSFPQMDAEILDFWERESVFKKTLDNRKDGKPFVFYEGPPTANGMPHAGHVLTRIMKDIFLRYKTMNGFQVPRRAGWDTHGLPVEVEVEKALGIRGREAIADYGLEDFSKRCIESVFKYMDEWKEMTRRIGFWVDLDDGYVTFHKSYVESVWWALKSLYDQGLIYQDYKVIWWWAQGGTALSAGEVGQGYKEVEDPSVLVRFPLAGESNVSLLAWTTTPWTLPSNIALACKADADYNYVKLEDEIVVCAEALLASVVGKQEYEVLKTVKGDSLVGLKYEAPFSFREPEPSSSGNKAHEVMAADFVELSTGSGLVHCAPAFGEVDFAACKENGFGFLQVLKSNGTFPEDTGELAGLFCKDADPKIIADLKDRNLLYRRENIRHEYPFCWRRMDDPLIQYARQSWFIRTTDEVHRAKANNQAMHWEPHHIKDGRFGQFLNGNVDWAISRERFWGTPLPIWRNDVTDEIDVVASVDEILERNPNAFDAFYEAQKADPSLKEDLMVHKPWIDDVTWTKPGQEGVFRRVPEVIDCWFDSGCMPFAQWGYPHQNQERFASLFPADFITEAVDQTRGWFYSLTMISSMLFPDQPLPHPFRTCVVLGLLTDEKGKKYSKSLKNYTDPLELMSAHGGDAVRWALYSNTVPGQNTRFFEKAVSEATREFLLKIWNVYSFFVTYAAIDGYADQEAPLPQERTELDRYILAELDKTIREVREQLDSFRSHLAVRALQSFLDALSNWYIRRSRGRFWENGLGKDKLGAYKTLHEVLLGLTKMIAPFTPFFAEHIFQQIKRKEDPLSVHLADYPSPSEAHRDDELCHAVALARQAVALGQKTRNESKIKVRQPLASATLVVANTQDQNAMERFLTEIQDELNVEEIRFSEDAGKFVEYQLLPNFRKLGPRLGQKVPLCKKALEQADGAALYESLHKRGFVEVELDGESISLDKSEVQVRLQAKEGFEAAAEGEVVVVLDTSLTLDLRRKGMARDFLREVQKERKEQDLPFDARIALTWNAEGDVAEALTEHGEWIARESLADSIARKKGGERTALIDDKEVKFSVHQL